MVPMPARRTLYIHAGLPKTGTSYLQGVFFRSVPALAAHGVALVPADQDDHLRVTLSVRRMLQEYDDERAHTSLERLRHEAAENTLPTALFTHESLAPCTPETAQPLLDAFGPSYEPHLIVTARDPGRQIPSAWQQRVQARHTYTYTEFLDAVFDRTELASDFWWNQDLQDVLTRWSQVIPPSRITVVTCPPPGASKSLLLERFCSVVGVDPAILDTSHREDNAALGQAQAELQRRVNVALGDRFPHVRAGYRRLGQVFLAGRILRPQGGRPAQLPSSRRAETTQLAAQWIEFISAGGFNVVGSLDELLPQDSSFTDQPAEVTAEELVDVAATAIADILERRSTELDERNALERRVRELEARVAELSGGREALKTIARQAKRRLRA